MHGFGLEGIGCHGPAGGEDGCNIRSGLGAQTLDSKMREVRDETATVGVTRSFVDRGWLALGCAHW